MMVLLRSFGFAIFLWSVSSTNTGTNAFVPSDTVAPLLRCIETKTGRYNQFHGALGVGTAPEKHGNTESKKKKASSSYRKKKPITIADLEQEILNNRSLYSDETDLNKKSKKRRSRQRVQNPQQTYLYAAQRKRLQQQNDIIMIDDEGSGDPRQQDDVQLQQTQQQEQDHPLTQARKEYGLLNSGSRHCNSVMDPLAEPEILGQIRVGDEIGSESYAYVINKPAGWSILGNVVKENKNKKQSNDPKPGKPARSVPKSKKKDKKVTRCVTIKEADQSVSTLEFNEEDVLAMMTPEERKQFELEGGVIDIGKEPVYGDTFDELSNFATPEELAAFGDDDDFDPNDIVHFDSDDVYAMLTPEELKLAGLPNPKNKKPKKPKKESKPKMVPQAREVLDGQTAENFKRIEARLSQNSNEASFAAFQRPSVVAWLKNLKSQEGNPIRGGNFWSAVAGATDVDDSGVVLLCPKTQVDNIFVDFAQYVAVVGNGKQLAKLTKKELARSLKNEDDESPIDLKIISKVRKGRVDDVVQTVRITIPEVASSCSSVIPHCQTLFLEGIRGDPACNPLDRRAARRLIHCSTLSVSSLSYDEHVHASTDTLPDDIAIVADRMNGHKFKSGSFLGRSELCNNPLTTAYREINGAADGFPGWIVDRYDKWLFVQHDENMFKGPLPSIHDGNTLGVYYLPSNLNRSAMGSNNDIRPKLIEGQPAPDFIPILENGITYHVSLDKDLSTGIFLDQRLHRAWLAKNCNDQTRVLNCFAHCGAFSVAAAAAGASTVSLDLSKKWLDRVEPQLIANGIPFDERHDCIYGDCFSWLEKLNSRGEKYDIVILDPPSASVGKKKKRWSVKNDMDELVALAAPLVKSGGLLWTTTNSASFSPSKFARMCKRGLVSVGMASTKLERIQPMPVDFPSIGPHPVTNLVWRVP